MSDVAITGLLTLALLVILAALGRQPFSAFLRVLEPVTDAFREVLIRFSKRRQPPGFAADLLLFFGLFIAWVVFSIYTLIAGRADQWVPWLFLALVVKGTASFWITLFMDRAGRR